ncbi:uncharacterized protein [Halyomorpha halys]|uniref:uncharacterized protein n=1 Tax=Halyomorpha halys TaxID=286706 RepID=UPI0006D4E0E3|nr:uncharacterized protein LOC106683451 [Halyomorpha halys]
MLLLYMAALYPLIVHTTLIPDLATIESCTNWHIVVTDKNVRKAIEFFRSCRNLGLTMGDLLPEDYMKTLATKLKTSNYQFLQQTNFAQPKLRMFEREFNDLYQEITILSEKVVGSYRSHNSESKKCTCSTKNPVYPTEAKTRAPTTTKTSRFMPSIDQDEPNRMDPFDYDYGSSINACSEAAFYIYLLSVAFLSLCVSIWTCRLASKTYRLLKDSQIDDDEAAYSHYKGSRR